MRNLFFSKQYKETRLLALGWIKYHVSTLIVPGIQRIKTRRLIHSHALMASHEPPQRTKIRLSNIVKFLGVKDVKDFVAKELKLPLDSVVCNKIPKSNFATISIRPEPDAELISQFIKQLDGCQWKKNKLKASIEVTSNRQINKRFDETRMRIFGPDDLNDKVIPLWKIPYSEQIILKQKRMHKIVSKYLGLIPSNDSLHEIPPSTQAPIEVMKSPMINGYRNKCEFTIGYDQNRDIKVGFLLGSYADGIVTVGDVQACLHVSENMKNIVNHMENLIISFKNLHNLNPYDRREKTGFWRLIMAREHDNEMMLLVQVDGSSVDPQVINNVEQGLKSHFETHINVKSLYIQNTNAMNHGIDTKSPAQLLFGQEHLTQTLGNLQFKISPLSFFQVNIEATKILYSVIKMFVLDIGDSIDVKSLEQSEIPLLSNLSKDKSALGQHFNVEEISNKSKTNKFVVLDLCCGTGTIGMVLAKSVDKVIGVEMIPSAIEDAKKNAEINRLENIQFQCAKVEEVIGNIIETIPSDVSIVVVLDPPRSGVHVSVIRAIRGCDRIKKAIYVACDAESQSVQSNFDDMTRNASKTLHGDPFRMTRMTAVDLFPHTSHCELAVCFNR